MAANPLSPDGIGNNRYTFFTNVEDTITAAAGGGQTNAYALTAQANHVTTVATAADSVSLPKITAIQQGDARPGAVGQVIYVLNGHATNALQVFGASPDTINGIATGTGISVPPGGTLIGYAKSYTQSTNVGAWDVSITSNPAVGTFVTSTVASGSAVSLTTNTSANVTSISLTAGDWEVWAQVDFTLGAASTTVFQAGVSATSATLPTQAGGSGIGTDPLAVAYNGLTTTTATISLGIQPVRVQLTTTTTIYLVAQGTFSAGTEAVYGTINARRFS